MSATKPKPVLCTCDKTFSTASAKLQHLQNSPRHITTPQPSDPTPWLDQLLQRLSLQDDEPDHQFVPFQGGEPARHATTNSSNTISNSLIAGMVPSVAEGTKPKKSKKSKKAKTAGTNIGRYHASTSITKINSNTGRTMYMLEDENWGLCDKDCGWCGHCTEGVDY